MKQITVEEEEVEETASTVRQLRPWTRQKRWRSAAAKIDKGHDTITTGILIITAWYDQGTLFLLDKIQ